MATLDRWAQRYGQPPHTFLRLTAEEQAIDLAVLEYGLEGDEKIISTAVRNKSLQVALSIRG